NRRLVRADDAAIDQIGGEPGVIGWVDAERRRQRLEYNSGRMPTVALALAILALQSGFDHGFAAYRDLLSRVVRGSRVDYRQLTADRAPLDRIVADLGRVAAAEERAWPRDERLAFWINAYNILTLRSIVDHYPIRGSFFSFSPRNSIRQIDGVWAKTRWTVAGRQLTLDDIEHTILRSAFKDPRVHMAINCASK